MRREVDEKFMKLALKEASKGLGLVSPNPLVGAVIVKDNKIIGSGYHQRSGGAHAEIEAIQNSSEDLQGSTLYCNLEPCCHTNKKTPPCVPVVIEAGFKRVVIANVDPNPEVSGKGIGLLKEAGIEVEVGVLEEEGKLLNKVFFHHIKEETPFIHLRAAQTLDGKIKSMSGDSKWISSEECRKESHLMRLEYDAVLIGRETLNNDNPKLNIRMGINDKNKTPKRIIWGTPENFNWDSYLLRENLDKNIFLVNGSLEDLDSHKKSVLSQGKIILSTDLEENLKKIKELGVFSVLVEGGSKVLTEFVNKQLFNQMTLFQAPKLIGNGDGIFSSEIEEISDSIDLKLVDVKNINGNIRIDLERKCSQE